MNLKLFKGWEPRLSLNISQRAVNLFHHREQAAATFVWRERSGLVVSPVTQSGLDENTDSAKAAPDAFAHANATSNQILSEQVRQLYGRGKAGSIVVIVALIGVWLPFLPHVEYWTIVPPLLVLTCAQLGFNALRERYLRTGTQNSSPKKWGERYALACLLSGSPWGIAALLWLPEAPFPEQALFSLVIAALCLNSILSRHVYPRALIAYTITSVGPTICTLAFTGELDAMVTAGLGLMAWSVASSGLHNLNKSSEESIALRFQNNALVDRLAESTVVAEQKAKDAENAISVSRKAASSRRDFLSMVTHEIRAPLASLSGLAHLLGATKLDATQQGYAKGVQESSRLLNRLVDDLADLTEMEALSINLRPVDVSPAKIARAAIDLMRHEASAKHLSIEIDQLPDTPRTIHNDPDRVKQTLVNLITRALRTTETGGVIVRLSPVDVGGKDPGVRFSVTDTGEGMPAGDAARLFSTDGYEDNLAAVRRRDVNLTICDRLVRLMGGRIGADSNEGNGFTAWFILGCALHQKSNVPTVPVRSMLTGQIVDLDRVYEIEQELGAGQIADHLNDVIGKIADTQKSLLAACQIGDLYEVQSIADDLAKSANTIGLTGLAESATSLLAGVDGATSGSAISEKANQLEAQFISGTHALTRAYPALAR